MLPGGWRWFCGGWVLGWIALWGGSRIQRRRQFQKESQRQDQCQRQNRRPRRPPKIKSGGRYKFNSNVKDNLNVRNARLAAAAFRSRCAGSQGELRWGAIQVSWVTISASQVSSRKRWLGSVSRKARPMPKRGSQ